MAKTVNEAMTAIADTIRHNALNNDDPIERPLSLDDMPDAISQVRNGGYGKGYQQGYEEGEEFGFSDGWVDNENMVVGELYDPVQKVKDYVSDSEGPNYDSVAMIRYIDENLPTVYENGQKAEYDRVWDAIQTKGNEAMSYDYMFNSASWNDTTFRPKYDIKPSYNGAVGLFGSNCRITDLEAALQKANVRLITELGGNYNESLRGSKLTVIPEIDLRKCTGTYEAFSGENLHTIRKILSSETTNWSTYAFSRSANSKLANIEIEGVIAKTISLQYQSLLTKASITSVMNALSKDITGQTITLNKTAVNNAFGINVDDESTYPEGSEYYTLRHSKDNWTFSYMNA